MSAALKGLENDSKASPVLAAVVREFHANAEKALGDGGRRPRVGGGHRARQAGPR